MNIPQSEVRYSSLSLVDIGTVFSWQGRLFRAISHGSTPAVRKMFDSGLVAKLVADRLLVDSWQTHYQLDGYGMVVEHERVPVPIYPREWSFSMLKDAAHLILRLNDTARQFGYQTKDCNGYNVLFHRGAPIYVDLGSFVEVAPNNCVLLAYEEFLTSYYYPLQIWRSAGHYLGGKVTPRALGVLLAPEAYFRYRWPLFRLLDDAALVQAAKTLNSIRTLQHNDLSRVRQRLPRLMLKLLALIKAAGFFSGPAKIDRLERKIAKLAHLSGSTTWSNYHDQFNRGLTPATTDRFDRVVEKLIALRVGSVLEFAGNQGVLSRLLKQRSASTRIICTDPDAVAIDKGYRLSKRAGEDIFWAVFNPFAYEGSPLEVAPEERFKADAVVVLALVHHLTLSRGLRLDYIFDVISRYARHYVFIEFMPLGLYNGTFAPEVPGWYSETWFADAFCSKFELLERVHLEPNRVLFIGSNAHMKN